ncbi:MAG: RNA polymerase sigma factor [Bacteroidales bacterium]|nr:RNA polymerase sigma factor [Bacteroidales bacterium]
MNQNDAQIIEGCLRKDERAYRALYDRFAPKMFGVCLRYTNSRAAAEDVLNDGFVKVFENLHRLRDKSLIEAWMRRIMVYTAINSQRKELPLASADEINTDYVSDYTTHDDIVSRIDASIVVQTMQTLPPTFRAAINLCEIEGYSYEEAAKMMGVKTSSLRGTLVRAKKMLAEKLTSCVSSK